jgi:hypothetical protein
MPNGKGAAVEQASGSKAGEGIDEQPPQDQAQQQIPSERHIEPTDQASTSGS